MYLLIRLDEGEKDYNNADSLLVSSVVVSRMTVFLVEHFVDATKAIAERLNAIDMGGSNEAVARDLNIDTSWQHWIFEESMRRFEIHPLHSYQPVVFKLIIYRICAIYRVVNMLVYFEPAAMCDLRHDLVLAPLPARKQLWEASDGRAWHTEVQSKPEMQTTFGLATNGELVQLNETQLHSNTAILPATLPATNSKAGISSSNSGNWEEWCSGMDSFGGLVMLAASFVV